MTLYQVKIVLFRNFNPSLKGVGIKTIIGIYKSKPFARYSAKSHIPCRADPSILLVNHTDAGIFPCILIAYLS